MKLSVQEPPSDDVVVAMETLPVPKEIRLITVGVQTDYKTKGVDPSLYESEVFQEKRLLKTKLESIEDKISLKVHTVHVHVHQWEPLVGYCV